MESAVIELFLALGIIIAASKMAGHLSRRIGQPRVLGELLVGVVLGPSLIDFLHLPLFDEGHVGQLEIAIEELAELGVLLLMFNIGLNVHISELARVGRPALFAGVLGALVPVGMTLGAMQPFDFSREIMLLVGVTLGATSVSISAQTLLELGLLRTKEGFALLATALVDDMLVILLLSFVVATSGVSAASGLPVGELALILAQMVAYIVAAGAVSWFIVPLFLNRINARSQVQGTAAAGLVLALVFGWSAEALGGMSAITGAFIAGVGITQADSEVRRKIIGAITHIAYAFLVPIFFVNVGLVADLGAIGIDTLPLAGVLIAVAIFSKLIGVGVGMRLGGFNNVESLRVSVCMIPRCEVALIIAAIGLAEGVFDAELFSTLLLVILLTAMVTPPLVRLVFREDPEDSGTQRPPQSVS